MDAEFKTITTRQRNAWLTMEDAALLSECLVDAYRASGPGGQKRNKTSSAVRLRHKPTGLIVISEESRSQHSNKRNALRRLRMAIAVELRPTDMAEIHNGGEFEPFVTPDARLRIAETNAAYALRLAQILDHVFIKNGSVNEVAQEIGVSASQVIRLLALDDGAFSQVNRMRESHGKPRLRRS